MKYYLAPMEGITGFIYRNAHNKHFGNIDKYFTPFLVPNESTSFKTREFRDVLPEHNEGLNVVPQILTNNSEGFIFTTEKLKKLGYKEVNLNLGCPSGTVVAKNRGSGFLAKRDELDKFLEEIYTMKDVKISIKTRLGKDSPEEFYELMKIYNKYPLEELIIHARIQKDFYGNKPNLEVFKDALKLSNHSLCYNGDIFTVDDYNNIEKEFPELDKVMIGRGIIANPALVNEIKGTSQLDKEILKEFHDDIINKYYEVFRDERNSMYRMKELWGYMNCLFENNKKHIKAIKKSQKLVDYKVAVDNLFRDLDIVEDKGFLR